MSRMIALITLLLCASPTIADAPPPVPERYARAVHHLNEGKYFESAIADLTAAVQAEPQNAATHLALGCAEADRAASLAHAATWQVMIPLAHQLNAKEFTDWQAAQRDPKSDDYGKPAPPLAPPPSPLQTRDDFTRYRLTKPQVVTRLNTLSHDAQAEWKTAIALSQTSEEKANAEYVQGWGLSLLKDNLAQVASSTQTGADLSDPTGEGGKTKEPNAFPGLKPGPTDKEIIAAFTAATQDAPDTAIYWQSLGDAQFPDFTSETPPSNDASLAAYHHALKLQPRLIQLWYRVYQMKARTPGRISEQAEADLRQVALLDNLNAYPHYELAAALFAKTKYNTRINTPGTVAEKQKAVDDALPVMKSDASEQAGRDAVASIEQGNAAPEYRQPNYQSPVPKMLLATWRYGDWLRSVTSPNFGSFGRRRELARAAAGYGDYLGGQKRYDEAEAALRASIGLGWRMIGNWPVEDDFKNGVSVIEVLVGIAVAAIGDKALLTLGQQSGNAVLTQEAQAMIDALTAQKKAYVAAFTAQQAQNGGTYGEVLAGY